MPALWVYNDVGSIEKRDLNWQLGQSENDGEELGLALQKTPIRHVI